MKFERLRKLKGRGVGCAEETGINSDTWDSGLGNRDVCPSILAQPLQLKSHDEQKKTVIKPLS